MTNGTLKLLLLAMAFTAATTQAHPGHGPLQHGAAHFLTSWFHLGATAVLCSALWLSAGFLQSTRGKTLARASAFTVAIVSLALWTFAR